MQLHTTQPQVAADYLVTVILRAQWLEEAACVAWLTRLAQSVSQGEWPEVTTVLGDVPSYCEDWGKSE